MLWALELTKRPDLPWCTLVVHEVSVAGTLRWNRCLFESRNLLLLWCLLAGAHIYGNEEKGHIVIALCYLAKIVHELNVGYRKPSGMARLYYRHPVCPSLSFSAIFLRYLCISGTASSTPWLNILVWTMANARYDFPIFPFAHR